MKQILRDHEHAPNGVCGHPDPKAHPLYARTTVASVVADLTAGEVWMTDGPFIESKEVLGGYWMVEANSKEELVKWAQRCPADPGDVIEIRQIFDAADFAIKK